ncbi:hypothetical protein [Hymenobacter jeollabukensis]|uniref:Uncharacterized protein n=1 Tax=Hymenobacter jeollabukensis TaxID=2025313 RepID=A0A5R8WP71_9BACT|nr:hypothetical protein [Hymenobacter jeollabukensis]TLM91766.1 hypothetical protein FDY95_14495 [Hymenobacter jeollabukensis]
MTSDELAQAGFLSARSITSAPQYTEGRLYVRLTSAGSLRMFVPFDTSQEVELSTGNLLHPDVLYRGSVRDAVALVQLAQHWSES